MPYYQDANTLVVNIPSSGGNIIDNSFKKKYKQTLFSGKKNTLLPPPHNSKSLQHQFYHTLIKHKTKCRLRTENLKCYTMVRNPYERVIEDLFHFRLIKQRSNKQQVLNILKKKYLTNI